MGDPLDICQDGFVVRVHRKNHIESYHSSYGLPDGPNDDADGDGPRAAIPRMADGVVRDRRAGGSCLVDSALGNLAGDRSELDAALAPADRRDGVYARIVAGYVGRRLRPHRRCGRSVC